MILNTAALAHIDAHYKQAPSDTLLPQHEAAVEDFLHHFLNQHSYPLAKSFYNLLHLTISQALILQKFYQLIEKQGFEKWIKCEVDLHFLLMLFKPIQSSTLLHWFSQSHLENLEMTEALKIQNRLRTLILIDDAVVAQKFIPTILKSQSILGYLTEKSTESEIRYLTLVFKKSIVNLKENYAKGMEKSPLPFSHIAWFTLAVAENIPEFTLSLKKILWVFNYKVGNERHPEWDLYFQKLLHFVPYDLYSSFEVEYISEILVALYNNKQYIQSYQAHLSLLCIYTRHMEKSHYQECIQTIKNETEKVAFILKVLKEGKPMAQWHDTVWIKNVLTLYPFEKLTLTVFSTLENEFCDFFNALIPTPENPHIMFGNEEIYENLIRIKFPFHYLPENLFIATLRNIKASVSVAYCHSLIKNTLLHSDSNRKTMALALSALLFTEYRPETQTEQENKKLSIITLMGSLVRTSSHDAGSIFKILKEENVILNYTALHYFFKCFSNNNKKIYFDIMADYFCEMTAARAQNAVLFLQGLIGDPENDLRKTAYHFGIVSFSSPGFSKTYMDTLLFFAGRHSHATAIIFQEINANPHFAARYAATSRYYLPLYPQDFSSEKKVIEINNDFLTLITHPPHKAGALFENIENIIKAYLGQEVFQYLNNPTSYAPLEAVYEVAMRNVAQMSYKDILVWFTHFETLEKDPHFRDCRNFIQRFKINLENLHNNARKTFPLQPLPEIPTSHTKIKSGH